VSTQGAFVGSDLSNVASRGVMGTTR
jgi:hypothetical protein